MVIAVPSTTEPPPTLKYSVAVSLRALFQTVVNGPEVEFPHRALVVSQVPAPPSVVPLPDQNSTVACTEEAARASRSRADGSHLSAERGMRNGEWGGWLGFINSGTDKLGLGGKAGRVPGRQHDF